MYYRDMATTEVSTAMTPLGGILAREGRLQSWLAESTGISKVRISRLVRGVSKPDVHEAFAIARALGHSPEQVWGIEDQPPLADAA